MFNISISIMFCTVFCIIFLFGTISLAAILLYTTCLIGSHHLHPGFLNSNIWLEINGKVTFVSHFRAVILKGNICLKCVKDETPILLKVGRALLFWGLRTIPYIMAYTKTFFNIIGWEKYVFLIELYDFSIKV